MNFKVRPVIISKVLKLSYPEHLLLFSQLVSAFIICQTLVSQSRHRP